MPEQPEPPTEVDVFEEHEVAIVESADGLEQIAAYDHGCPRREEHVLLDIERRVVGLANMELEPVAVEGQSGIDEVDRPSLPVEHLAGNASESGVTLQRRDRRPQPSLVGPGIVVQEGGVLAPPGLHAAVAPAGEPEVLLGADDLRFGDSVPDQVDAAVA